MIDNSVQLTIKLTPESLAELNQLAAKRGVKRAALIKSAIEQTYNIRPYVRRPTIHDLFKDEE